MADAPGVRPYNLLLISWLFLGGVKYPVKLKPGSIRIDPGSFLIGICI